MIQFFRKIRHKLISNGKTTRYLKYALGEIGLVVIGILIALQINNWNEARKSNIIERDTLISLKTDLDSALVQLNEKILQNEYFRNIDSTLLAIINSQKPISQDSLEVLTLSHIWSPGFDPELGTLNDILSSGKMGIIKDKTLRMHISSWNKYMDELAETDSYLSHYDLNVKDPLYSKYIPYKNSLNHYLYSGQNTDTIPHSNFKWNSESLLVNKEFENMLSHYMIYSTIQYDRLLDIQVKINEMISLINEEIEQ